MLGHASEEEGALALNTEATETQKQKPYTASARGVIHPSPVSTCEPRRERGWGGGCIGGGGNRGPEEADLHSDRCGQGPDGHGSIDHMSARYIHTLKGWIVCQGSLGRLSEDLLPVDGTRSNGADHDVDTLELKAATIVASSAESTSASSAPLANHLGFVHLVVPC